jgi:hypothetical protein
MLNRPSFAHQLTKTVLVLSIVGCSGATAPAGQLQMGDYTLRSINGTALPVTLTDGSTVVAGVLHIAPTGVAMDQTLAPVSGPGGTMQVIQHGNYRITQSGSSFFLESLEYGFIDTGYVQGANIIVRHHADASPSGTVQLNNYSR